MAKRKNRRTTRAVIDQAIRENRRWEWVCLVMTAGFALAGVGVTILGAVRGDGITSLAGAAAGALSRPAFNAAATVRRQNIAVRLLEVPLETMSTADALEAIRRVVLNQPPAGSNDVANPT